MIRDASVINRHGHGVTDQPSSPACMTDMTDHPGMQQVLFMTHDGSSLGSPLTRAHDQTQQRQHPNASSVSPTSPQLPLIPTDRYITERAQLGRCRHCNQPTIRADLGAQICVSADPHRLTPLAELEHKLAGHWTYELLPDTDHGLGPPILRARHLSQIRWRPGRALPEHHCGTRRPLDPELLTRLGPRPATPDDQADDHLDQGAPF